MAHPMTPAAATATTNSGPAVVFDNVYLGFDEGDILRGVSFSVPARETMVLLGETGTGKTLTLKLAAGLLKPTRGSINVLGQEVSTMSEIEPRVQEALQFVELEHTADQLPSELSGGMRRRVSIARALINRPDIVLYDSPTAGLDPVTSQTIISLIMRLRDVYGVTALLATQRLQDGFALANFCFDKETKHVVRTNSAKDAKDGQTAAATRFMVYKDGRIYFEGDPQELSSTKDPYLRRFLV